MTPSTIPFTQLGPYRLDRKLGQGGMGTVFAGIDVGSGEAAAIKVLSPALAADEGFRARFESEIDSLKKLRHPHIVRLYGYGEQSGTLFYAMELVEGTSLEDELKARRRFDWREVTQLTIKLCRALKHAHDHGVIHRDIKPANLLLARDGQIKLSDFGIARLFGSAQMTSEGGVLGTAEYMAPEQADGRPVTDRCDQYSLGGVMFALLAGRPPFRANTLLEMLQLQRFAEPPPVRQYAPDTPAELERIILQLLEKDPSKRFANAALLARSLEAMERGLSITSSRAEFLLAPSEDSTQGLAIPIDPLAPTFVPPESLPQPFESNANRPGNQLFPPARSVTQQVEATVPHAGDDDAPAPQGSNASAAPTPARFTKIGQHHPASESSVWQALEAMLAPQTLALTAALLVMGVGAWYALRPPSADALYERIEQQIATGQPEDLWRARTDIGDFRSRYPADARIAELPLLHERIELAQLERRLDRSARLRTKPEEISPVERAYVEAIDYAALHPEMAVAKLQALLDFYGDSAAAADLPASTRQVLELSRRQLERLHGELARLAKNDLPLVESRLKRAETLAKTDPAAARQIWRGLIELYGDKPWAADPVASARAALLSTEGATTAVDDRQSTR